MTETEEKINAMFERLVPPSGKCGTVAGEIVWAISRIGFRYLIIKNLMEIWDISTIAKNIGFSIEEIKPVLAQ